MNKLDIMIIHVSLRSLFVVLATIETLDEPINCFCRTTHELFAYNRNLIF
jgi:hypothetical protein